MTRQTIGAFLATQRKAHGYTQEEVADRLGISNRTLSKWETDRSSPDIFCLPALADLYGVTVDEILRGERARAEEGALSQEEQSKKEEQAQKARRALQKRALASFSAKTYIAYGIAAGGLLLAIIASFLVFLYRGELAAFILLAVSAAANAGAAILLFALRAGSAEAAEDARFALPFEQKFFRALRIILTAFFAECAYFALSFCIREGEFSFGALAASFLLLLAAAAYALTAATEVRRAANRAEGAAQRFALRDKKLAAHLFPACCAVLAALLIAAVPLAQAHPASRSILVSGSAQEVRDYMHTLVWKDEYNLQLGTSVPAGEYPLDLRGINEDAPVSVGGGFWAQKVTTEVLFFFPDQSNGEEGAEPPSESVTNFAFSAALLGQTADGTEIYNVRFADPPIFSAVTVPVDAQYRLTEEGDTCSVVWVRTYSIDGAVGGICLAASCVGSAAMLILWNALRSRQKFSL